MLPTDSTRKIAEVVKRATIVGVKEEGGEILVQAEYEEGALTPWMRYAKPFIGGTKIFTYPAIGTGGEVFSEAGENEVNIFYPTEDHTSDFSGLGADDFLILFKNGDKIHHKGGELTITTSGKASVNAKEIVGNAEKITGNATLYTMNASQINLNGNVKVAGSFSQVSGGARSRSGYSASFTSPVTFLAPIYAVSEMTINGIPFTTHKHDTPAGMSSTPQ